MNRVAKKLHRAIGKTSVTSKTGDLEISRAISRRAKRLTRTELIDHAVPETVLFRGGVWPSSTSTFKPFVLHGEHVHSPFILSLKTIVPTPEELLSKAPQQPLGVNLIDATANAYTPSAPDLSRDLILSPQDVLDQVKRSALSTLPMLPSTISHPHHSALRYDTSLVPTFSSDAFIPHDCPKDIFSYFDFPEEESVIAQTAQMSDGLDPFDLDIQDEEPQASQPQPSWWQRIPVPVPILHLPATAWNRTIASFIGLSFLFVLPLHAMNVIHDLRQTKVSLEQTGLEAVSLLSSGTQAALARDIRTAGSNFKSAGAQFQTAKQTMDDVRAGTSLLLSLLPLTHTSYETGKALMEAGEEIAIAGGRMSDGYQSMEQETAPTPVSRLNILETYLSSTVPHLEAAQNALSKVNFDVIPEEHQATLNKVQTAIQALLVTIDEFESFSDLVRELLGADGTRRYLVVFQNNTEIRPTGGFIGSFAEIKVRDGVMEHLHVPGGGSYDLQGTLQQNLRAPEPLQLLTARWEFQDGNWFPDFPTSARQLMQFYQNAGGPSVDGVLAVNATFVSQLIGLLGPIDMPDYHRVITQENFIFEAQKIAEYEYDKTQNTPKAFIGDLAPLLMERTIEKTSKDFLAVMDSLNKGLVTKDLQLYLVDQDLERLILKHGWGGEIKQTDADYLMVVDTNLGGGKTDGVIEQNVDLRVEIADDGTITNTLTISRTHLGIQGLLFTGVNNVDFLRVYVPKGSTLLDATGFSIPDQSLFDVPDDTWSIDDDLAYGLLTTTIDPKSGTRVSEEHGKAVFGNWVQTMPGSTSTVTLRYRLPFTVNALESNILASLQSLVGLPQTETYSLLVQKQSGVLDRTTRIHITLPEELKIIWASHDPTTAELTNQTDALFALILESN